MMRPALLYTDWHKMAHDEYAVTIKDILSLKKGEQLKVLRMDRNVWDTALRDEIRGKSCEPQDFFGGNWAIYVHEENLKGKLLFFSFESEKFGYPNDVDQIDPELVLQGKICRPDFEFEIEYKDHCW